MPALRLDQLRLPTRPGQKIAFRIWREWCFLRMAARHLGWRLVIMAAVLIGGGLLFQRFEPQHKLSLVEATYYTFSLVFGEAPERFPASNVLRVLFFVVPILGLTVIIEGVVDLALLVRDRRRFERNWCLMMAASMSNHIVLVGVGRLGYRIFRLLRRLGEPVIVIEQNSAVAFLDEVRREGSPLIIGDARNERLLEDANVAKARSVILATNDDLANLEIALDARRLNPAVRVVVRMFDQNLADKIRDGFNIHIALSQSAMSAPGFAMAAIDPGILGSFILGDRLIVMLRRLIKPADATIGKNVADLLPDLGCALAELRRPGREPLLFPPTDTTLLPGDEIVIQGPLEAMSQVRERFGH